MDVKEFLKHTCETCDKELETQEEYWECFNKNHNLRMQGQFTIKNGKRI